ncbi:MAG TPA: thioesterase family protein [Beijerinckiaceae bacterium]|nr:thioesterase family protein [Beijerinckiaceae bacterium]
MQKRPGESVPDPLDPTLPENRFFVIARLGIDFRAELNFPGRVRTGTWITRLGRSSVSLAQVILSGDTLAAEADAVCVLMDGGTRRPMPYPDATRRALESMLRPTAP